MIPALAVALIASAATPAAPAPIWIRGADGQTFRVRFDPGERLVLGAGFDVRGTAAGAAIEAGLFLRSEPPPEDWDVYWKRDHEIAHVRLATRDVDGVLYRGLFLRQSRQGTLTLPLSPPVALPLPFDIGLLAEVGRLEGPLAPRAVGPALDARLVHGEVVVDFLRSRQPGRWLLAGVGARYDVGLARAADGTLARDHRVTPMSELSLAAHGQRADGLLAGGARIEAAQQWSSARGWERAYRLEGEIEAIPIAVNDRPVSVFAAGTADAGGGLAQPDLRFVIGVRVAEPLR